MTSDDDLFNIDIDPMLFMQMVVDDHLALIEDLERAGDSFGPMLGMPGLTGMAQSVAEVGREKVAEAQAHLDTLVAADPTWQPCYGTDCIMIHEDIDPELGEILRCTVHNYTVIADAYVCEGYQAPPYVGP
jgi:hypothetical protein